MPKNGIATTFTRSTLSAFITVILIMLSSRRVSSLSSTMSSSKAIPLHIHWFRQDLRLLDNPALNKTTLWKSKMWSSTAKFLLDSVMDLRNNLEKKGSGLVVAYGKPEEVLSKLCRALQDELDISSQKTKDGSEQQQRPVVLLKPSVVVQEEPASEEYKVDRAVQRAVKTFASGSLETVWAATLYDLEDLPFDNGVKGMPDTFTPFRNKVEKHCKIPAPLPVPPKSKLAMPTHPSILSILQGQSPTHSIPNCSLSYMPTLSDLGYSTEEIEKATHPDPRGVMPFHGGETSGLQRIQEYIFNKDLLKIYFDTRNGMLIPPSSPHGLHMDASLPDSSHKSANDMNLKRGIVNKSTYWVVFELLWGCFFRMFALKYGNQIFFLDGTLGRQAHGSHPNSRRWGLNPKHLQAWKEGRTGYPLVDANMRELHATGFMSNRGRQNVASFLAIDMSTDWRYGADHFESLLVDHDVYANWGNWCSAAGMTGGRLNRFNIVKQSKDYDKEGEYVRHWCPELANVPTKFIHEPWKLTKDQQKEYGVRLGVDYPNPLVPPTSDGSSGGSSGNGGYKNYGKDGKSRSSGKKNDYNPNRGRGQRKDMKSLKQGSYQFRDTGDNY
eukprot:CAMPEP_0176476916 /NCGR_PEP_ID=MMETSP0200_2-20121128/322_1 /TAXON_ID=947934 /ORGANISM="Chaetoceros sp., Strain GSL56" /LENGTH=609 /DNA_ID=CAMNT_0017872647 /DNA_START=21 /DNA_END=1850 /DNA_ORIENTATION=-